MGNRRLYKIECLHTLGTPESERLKVTALNLFHPTASPLFQKVGFFHIATQSLVGGDEGEGDKSYSSPSPPPSPIKGEGDSTEFSWFAGVQPAMGNNVENESFWLRSG